MSAANDRIADRFADHIGPQQIRAQVANALPWLEHDASAESSNDGWMALLRQDIPSVRHPGPTQRAAFFSLCLAAHHATVASYAPTNLDAIIRGHRWRESDEQVLDAQEAAVRSALTWSIEQLNPRRVAYAGGIISSHDGEWLAVLCGCVGAWLRRGRADRAAAVAALIDAELTREAEVFRSMSASPERDLDALILAAIITHNVGDLDQGLSYWSPGLGAAYVARWHDLAHGDERHHGAFAAAARLYAATIACEGHRNYPLRHVPCLRADASLWLPMGPFLDAWGTHIAHTPLLSDAQRGEVVAALCHGVATIRNQLGYQRALAGMASAANWERVQRTLTAAQKTQLRHPAITAALKESPRAFSARWSARVAAWRASEHARPRSEY